MKHQPGFPFKDTDFVAHWLAEAFRKHPMEFQAFGDPMEAFDGAYGCEAGVPGGWDLPYEGATILLAEFLGGLRYDPITEAWFDIYRGERSERHFAVMEDGLFGEIEWQEPDVEPAFVPWCRLKRPADIRAVLLWLYDSSLTEESDDAHSLEADDIIESVFIRYHIPEGSSLKGFTGAVWLSVEAIEPLIRLYMERPVDWSPEKPPMKLPEEVKDLVDGLSLNVEGTLEETPMLYRNYKPALEKRRQAFFRKLHPEHVATDADLDNSLEQTIVFRIAPEWEMGRYPFRVQLKSAFSAFAMAEDTDPETFWRVMDHALLAFREPVLPEHVRQPITFPDASTAVRKALVSKMTAYAVERCAETLTEIPYHLKPETGSFELQARLSQSKNSLKALLDSLGVALPRKPKTGTGYDFSG